MNRQNKNAITMAEFLNISIRFSSFDLQSGSNAFDWSVKIVCKHRNSAKYQLKLLFFGRQQRADQ